MVDCKVSPSYLLDEMTMFEIEALMDRYTKRTTDRMQQSWEQSRWQAYVNAKIAGSKIQSAAELMTFPWEETTVNLPKPTPEQLQRMKDEAREAYKNFTQGKTEEVQL